MSVLFSSESVCEGHPDKVCDLVSDAVLDAALTEDPNSRVACECYTTTGLIVIGGEITTKSWIDFHKVARDTIREIGYTKAEYRFDADSCGILLAVARQSPDIAMGVDKGGAGDQGMMFGYACNHTKEFMPLPIQLAHQLAKRLAEVRKSKDLPYLGPDGKTQVTVEYRDGRPARVDYVVIAASHTADVVSRDGKHTTEEAKQEIIAKVVRPVVGDLIDQRTKIVVNGTGKFLVSGPQSDTGLTGRKIMVDTYGGWSLHGGGAFSGKDPSKVDRSGGYMARHIAKNIVAAGLAEECLVQLGYCIGLVDPVSVMVNSFGTSKVPEDTLPTLVQQVFPLSPKGIIDHLKLRRPIYLNTAAYGHFGRPEFSWEEVNMTDELLAKARKL